MLPFTDPADTQRRDEAGVEFSDYLFIVLNRWPLLILGLSISAIFGAFLFLNQVPIYSAECVIMGVDPNSAPALEFDNYATFSRQDKTWKIKPIVEKLVVMVKSRRIAREVARRLQLHKRPPFKAPLKVIVADLKKRWGFRTTTPPQTKSDEGSAIKGAGGQVSGGLTAEAVADSQLIRIKYTDADQENIHKILNEVVKVLDETTLEFKREQVRDGQTRLKEQAVEILKSLRDAEARLKAFNRANNAVQSDNEIERISQMLNKQVGPQIAETELKLAEVETREHEGRATPEDVRVSLDLKAKVQYMEKVRADAIGRIKKLIELKSQLDKLERNVKSLHRLNDTFDLKIRESLLNELLASSDVALVEGAERPEAPVFPSVPKFVVMVLGLGFGMGLAMILITDYRDPSLKRVDEIRRMAGTPILSFLPKERRKLGQTTPLARVTCDEPRNPLAESFRTLQASIRVDSFHALGGPRSTKICFVTSPGPGDGKTTTSVNLAICMAQSGLKTLLVEADLRRPTISLVFNCPNLVGLSNFDLAHPEQALNRELVAGLHYLPSGPSIDTPAEYLASMLNRHEFVAFLEKYDRVVFDAPPAPVADTLVIAQFAKRAIFVISCDTLTRVSLRSSLRQIFAAGAKPIGIFANFVSPNASESRGVYALYSRYEANKAYSSNSPTTRG